VIRALPPSQPVLRILDSRIYRHANDPEHHDDCVDIGDLKAAARLDNEVAKPSSRPEHLGDHGDDKTYREADAKTDKDRGESRWKQNLRCLPQSRHVEDSSCIDKERLGGSGTHSGVY